MASVLDVPGYGGYLQRRGQIEKEQATAQQQELAQAGALQKLYMNQQAMQQERTDRAQLEEVMSATGGDAQKAIEALLRAGTPKSIELASKLKGLLPDKPAQPQLVTVPGPDGKPVQRWIRPGETTGVDVGLKYEKPDELKAPPTRNRYDGTTLIQEEMQPDGTWKRIGSGPRFSDRPLVDLQVGPTAPGGPPAVPADVQGPSATGGSGFFGGMANTVADMFGANLPYPNVERATQALKNLRVQTITLMQDAVPGRPSNYLMQQIEQLAVQPGSLLQGDQRAQERLSRTRDMIATEVARMEREVLAQPKAFTTAQVNKTRLSHGALRQLLSEYDRVLSSFSGVGGAVPPPPPGFVPDSP